MPTRLEVFREMVSLGALMKCIQDNRGWSMPLQILDAAYLVSDDDLERARPVYDASEYLMMAATYFVEFQLASGNDKERDDARPEWLPDDYWTRRHLIEDYGTNEAAS